MHIFRITSKDNKTLKEMRRPEKHGNILVEGPKLIEEALEGGLALDEVAVASSKKEEYKDLLNRCKNAGARLLEAPDRIMAGIGDAVTGQGIVALARQPEYSLESISTSNMRLLLVLDAIQDPGNVGAMLRSAYAFDVSAAIALDGTANPFGSKAIRASAGACFHLPVVATTAGEFLEYSRNTELPLAALDGSAETDISAHALPTDCAIIVGNEGAGIRTELRQACQAVFRIPINEGMESLNAAVAASIALYELTRIRTTE